MVLFQKPSIRNLAKIGHQFEEGEKILSKQSNQSFQVHFIHIDINKFPSEDGLLKYQPVCEIWHQVLYS